MIYIIEFTIVNGKYEIEGIYPYEVNSICLA